MRTLHDAAIERKYIPAQTMREQERSHRADNTYLWRRKWYYFNKHSAENKRGNNGLKLAYYCKQVHLLCRLRTPDRNGQKRSVVRNLTVGRIVSPNRRQRV